MQKPAPSRAGGVDQPVERQVRQRVDVEIRTDLFEVEVGRQQLAAGARIHPVEARPPIRRRRHPHVDFDGTRFAQHADHLSRRRAPHDGIVDHDHAAPFEGVAQRIELHAHTERTQLLRRRDERAADVAILDEPLPERNATAAGEAFGGRDARLGYAHDQIGDSRSLIGEQLAHTQRARRARSARRACCRGGRSRRTRRCTSRGSMASGANGRSERGPFSSMITISPGSSSRTSGGADDIECRCL